MKFMIVADIPPETGNQLDGDPAKAQELAALIGWLLPEAGYIAADRRRAFLVLETNDVERISEFMVRFSRLCNAYAQFQPVIPLAEFPTLQGRIMQRLGGQP